MTLSEKFCGRPRGAEKPCLSIYSILWKDLKCVCLSVCLVRSGPVRSVPIEFPRKYIGTVCTLVLLSTTQRKDGKVCRPSSVVRRRLRLAED